MRKCKNKPQRRRHSIWARPDIAPDARMLVERPCLILYRLIPEGMQVVRVLHGARHIDRLLFAEGGE